MITRAQWWLDRRARNLAPYVVQWTGKHPQRVLPKHCLPQGERLAWITVRVPPHALILDVGSGAGTHARFLRELGHTVFEVDRPWDLEQGLPKGLPVMDAVLCLDVLEHIHARQQLLAHIRSVLGGALFLSLPQRGTSWRHSLWAAGLDARQDPDHKIEYSVGSMQEELAAAGYTQVMWTADVYDSPWSGWMDLIGALSLSAYARLQEWKLRMGQAYPKDATGWRIVTWVA